ncbi:magnesium transporter NIPA-domain-containing protein [Cryomyces antarcticus]
MYIPPLADVAGLHTPSLSEQSTYFTNVYRDKSPIHGWSSLIGIITAICGNILISFALNTQRYAHIKLGREQEAGEKSQRDHKRQHGGQASYGTQDAVAKGRAKKNLKPGQIRNANGAYDSAGEHGGRETDALIPSLRSSGSESSVNTIRDGEKPVAPHKQKSYLGSPYWWLGIILMTIGEAGNFLAYGFAPASIVSPLGVVALVSNCIIAPFMLKEPFRKQDFLGVMIAIAGAVTVVLSASVDNPKLGPDEIWELITTWEFETYLGITVVLIIGLVAASNRYGDRTVLIDLGLVGLFGGYTALSTKGVASLLSYTIWRVVTFPITYLLVAILVFTAVMQIKYLNRALQRFDSTQVIPIQFVLFTLSVIIGSAVLYQDFKKTTLADAAKFVGGCALTFLGVWFITSGRRHQDDSEEHDLDEEDPIDLVDEERYQDEVESDPARRTSRVSIPPAIEEQSSESESAPLQRLHSSASHTPSITLTPHHGPETPSTPLKAPLLDLDDPSPLTSNPWSRSSDYLSDLPAHPPSSQPPRRLQPPSLLTAASSPLLPSEATHRPRTPRKTSDIHSPGQPATPAPGAASAQHQRPSVLSRNSIAGILGPGPLTSPLSGSLSAVVADSLRRGADVSSLRVNRKGSRRPTLPGVGVPSSSSSARRPSKRASDTGVVDPFGASPLKTAHAAAGGEEDAGGGLALAQGQGSPVARGRSVSATLGEFLRIKKARAASHDGDEERGAAGL